VFATLATLGVGFALFVEAVKEAREAARESSCKGRFAQLYLALRNYHDEYGAFPPAYLADEQGQPMHSWRVLILPYIAQQEIYDQYKFDEPWNSPHNRALGEKAHTAWFHCPSGPHTEHSPITDYVVVVGEGTAFPGSRSTSMDDFQDGLEDSILIVEIANSNIHWMEPRDLDFNTMSFTIDDRSRPSISSPHPCGPGALFADYHKLSYGHHTSLICRLHTSLSPASIKAMLTISGGEGFHKQDHLERVGRGRFRCRCIVESPKKE
jgi:hypothetical protein